MNLHPLWLPLSCVPPTAWPKPTLSHPLSFHLQKHVCQHLADPWKPLQFAASWLSLVPFSFSFLLLFTSSHSLQSSILSWTWHPALPLFCKQISQGMANATLHGEACTKDVDQKSLLPGLWTLLQTVHIHPCFGYIWWTLVSSFSQLLRIFLCSFLERALPLQPLSKMGLMF